MVLSSLALALTPPAYPESPTSPPGSSVYSSHDAIGTVNNKYDPA